tara:strand:+ start:332 stop:514 length:183 start_codon:yes stop_codon:yes gene_type:complete
MVEVSSDQKFYMCASTFKALEETTGGKMSVIYSKDQSGSEVTRFVLEYEDPTLRLDNPAA